MGNRLVSVSDEGRHLLGADLFGFSDGTEEEIEYEYDENGNTVKDLNRKVSSIQYNSLNLPSKMTFTDGSIFRYTYDAMGRKQKSSYHVGGDQMVGPVSPGTEPFPGILSLGGAELMDVPGQQSVTIVYDSIEYCGNVLYDNGNLDKVFVDGGYATLNATTGQPTFHFYVFDHLGSVRRIVRQDGVVERTNHYYPYGGLHGESTGMTAHRFRFSGKEYDPMCGLNGYDFGARWQQPDLTRFGQMDPLAEKTPDVSPYAYCAGDPVNRIDPDGRLDWPLKGYTAVNKKDFANGAWGLDNTIVRTSLYNEIRNVGTSPHIGIDYRASKGTPIYNLGDGRVFEMGTYKSGINYIIIEYGNGDRVRFLHLDSFSSGLKQNDIVYEGQIIGYTGNSGQYKDRNGNYHSYPEHLHVDAVDKDGIKINQEQNNYGTISNEDFFEKYNGDYKSLQNRTYGPYEIPEIQIFPDEEKNM